MFFKDLNSNYLSLQNIITTINLFMDLNEIKGKILTEIAKTAEKIDEYEEMAQPIAPDSAIGRISRMDAIINKTVKKLFFLFLNQKII